MPEENLGVWGETPTTLQRRRLLVARKDKFVIRIHFKAIPFSTVKEWSELLTAIAALLWPVLSFLALLLFKPRISEFISRLKKGKLFGQEFELTDVLLANLERRAINGETEVLKLPQTAQSSLLYEEENEVIKQVLHEAAKSPKVGLLLLSTELERELRHTLTHLSPSSNSIDSGPLNIRRRMDELLLHYKESLPSELAESTKLFLEVRNRLVHGLNANPDQVLSAIDSGLKILRSLKSISG